MIRTFALGLLCLSLTACGGRYHPRPIEYRAPPADVPDAALVAPCDTSDNPTPTNGEMADELARNRGQRNDCATRMGGVAQWRADAIRRAAEANAPPSKDKNKPK
jgi:hypothetical protein